MQVRVRFAAVVAGFSVVMGGVLALGDEPKACQCPQAGVPMVGQWPNVSRLFRCVGVRHEPGCEAGQCVKTPCADQLERIGIDFECQTCPDHPVVRFGPVELAICTQGEDCCCRGKECPVACAGSNCPAHEVVSHTTTVCQAGACAAKCGETRSCEGECCEGKCCEGKCSCAAAVAAKSAHHSAACQCAGRDGLWKHIVQLATEKGVAEGALEAREEHSELLDALVEMATKTAALEAKLEAQAEHHKLMEQMVELASENAGLKARAELAEAKAAMLKETIPVAVENELLSRRVAELEERLAAHDAADDAQSERTAKKAAARKAR